MNSVLAPRMMVTSVSNTPDGSVTFHVKKLSRPSLLDPVRMSMVGGLVSSSVMVMVRWKVLVARSPLQSESLSIAAIEIVNVPTPWPLRSKLPEVEKEFE